MRHIIILVVVSLALIAAAHAWDCKPIKCTFDMDCDIGCECYKAKGAIDGVCVPKR